MQKPFLKFNFCLLALLNFVLVSCRSAPYTDRNQFMIISEEQEIQLGSQAYRELLSSSRISNNKYYNERLERVAGNITKAAEKNNYVWEHVIIESDQANAFCLPGGKIVFYSAFFEFFNNDGELAAIVGHEVAHALARHHGERMSLEMTAQLTNLVFTQVMSEVAPAPDAWSQLFGTAGQLGLILPYSRTQEYEADYIGMILMAKAGYDPKYAVEFWERFQKSSNYDTVTEFFTTHPVGKKRLEELKNNLQKANKYYSKSIKQGWGWGESYQH